MTEIDKKEAQEKVLMEIDPIMKKLAQAVPSGLTKNQAISVLQLFVEIYY